MCVGFQARLYLVSLVHRGSGVTRGDSTPPAYTSEPSIPPDFACTEGGKYCLFLIQMPDVGLDFGSFMPYFHPLNFC